jgi:hypothetical protein
VSGDNKRKINDVMDSSDEESVGKEEAGTKVSSNPGKSISLICFFFSESKSSDLNYAELTLVFEITVNHFLRLSYILQEGMDVSILFASQHFSRRTIILGPQ